jgi:hypothetical protein
MNGIIQSESYLAKTSYLPHNLSYTTWMVSFTQNHIRQFSSLIEESC